MLENNIDRNEICKALDFKYSTFTDWYNGKKYPRIDKIEKLASFFGILKSDLIERKPNNTHTHPKKGVKIPVLGSVSAGTPIEAIQDIIDYEEIEEELAKKGEFFGLKVKGDSMFPYIIDKDIAIVKKQPNCESGQIAVVQVNGGEATIKRVIKEESGITLKPFNPMYAPTTFSTKDLQNPVAIIGVVVEIRRKELAL